MSSIGFDELQHGLYGFDYSISDRIKLHHPTIRQMMEYGEKEYMALVHGVLCGRPYDYMVELDDQGIDFETIPEFVFFTELLSKSITQKGEQLLFSGFCFSKARVMVNQENGVTVLFDPVNQCLFDRLCYENMVQSIRAIHHIPSQPEYKPGNKLMKQKLIESERKKHNRMRRRGTTFESSYINYISALVNSPEFKYNYDSVLDLTMGQFLDALSRISKIKAYNFTMSGIYAGTVDARKISVEELSWFA